MVANPSTYTWQHVDAGQAGSVCRDAALGVILDAAVAEDAGVHSKAIRLLANRLFPQPIATAQVACLPLNCFDTSGMTQHAPSSKMHLAPCFSLTSCAATVCLTPGDRVAGRGLCPAAARHAAVVSRAARSRRSRRRRRSSSASRGAGRSRGSSCSCWAASG